MFLAGGIDRVHRHTVTERRPHLAMRLSLLTVIGLRWDAGCLHASCMTPQELIAFRARMGLDRKELARRLDISPSRLKDYELGQTRTNPARPAPIPKVVELACAYLMLTSGPSVA